MGKKAKKRTPKRAPLNPRAVAVAAIEASIGIAKFRGFTRAALRRELRRKRAWFIDQATGGTPLGFYIGASAASAIWYRAVRAVAGCGVRELTRSEQLRLPGCE